MADPKSRVSIDAVGQAVDALLRWMRARTKQRKAQLIEHDDILHLVLTLKKIPPSGRTNPYRIPLPHPLHSFSDPSAAASICLIVDDTAKSPLSPSAARARIAADSLPIADVIALSALRSDYRPYEARRRLCDSHDLFFADRRILPLLPRLLGKHFFKKKKTPHAVDLSRVGWPEQIRQCCDSTLLYLRTGTCSGIKVGRVSQDREEIVANAMAAIKGAVELVPKKWANVRSIHIKSVESLALPIYQVVPDMGLKIEGFEKEEGTFEGELVQLEEEKSKGVSKNEALKKKKKKRIHEVQLMDTDNDGNESDEKSVKSKAKKAKKDHSDGGGEGEGDENNELSDKEMIKGIKKAKKVEEDVDGGQGDEKSAGKRTKKKAKKDEDVDGVEGDVKSGGKRTKKKAKKDEDVGGEGDEKSAGKRTKKKAKKDGADDEGEGDAGNAFGSEMIKAKTVKTKRSKAGNEEGKGVKRIKGIKVRHVAV